MPHCQSYIESLQKLGYRITPQREMIIEALAHSPHHVTAEEIYEQVRTRSRAVNIATVYRTLDLLVDEGIAHRAGLKDGIVVYATADHGPHIHLICRGCGSVINADQALVLPLDKRLRRQYQFSPDLQHLTIAGLCADCQLK